MKKNIPLISEVVEGSKGHLNVGSFGMAWSWLPRLPLIGVRSQKPIGVRAQLSCSLCFTNCSGFVLLLRRHFKRITAIVCWIDAG